MPARTAVQGAGCRSGSGLSPTSTSSRRPHRTAPLFAAALAAAISASLPGVSAGGDTPSPPAATTPQPTGAPPPPQPPPPVVSTATPLAKTPSPPRGATNAPLGGYFGSESPPDEDNGMPAGGLALLVGLPFGTGVLAVLGILGYKRWYARHYRDGRRVDDPEASGNGGDAEEEKGEGGEELEQIVVPLGSGEGSGSSHPSGGISSGGQSCSRSDSFWKVPPRPPGKANTAPSPLLSTPMAMPGGGLVSPPGFPTFDGSGVSRPTSGFGRGRLRRASAFSTGGRVPRPASVASVGSMPNDPLLTSTSGFGEEV